MAQDSFRRVQESQAFTHSSVPKSSQLHPGLVVSPIQYSDDSERQRYRDGSPGQRSRIASDHLQKDRQPINDAVTSAVGKDAANALPPEILDQITSQITASVLQRLLASNSDGSSPVPPLNSPTHPPPPANSVPAPSVQSDNSPPLSHRSVYTPPSPHRPSDGFPPVAPGSPTASTHSIAGRFSPDNNRRPLSPAGQQNQSEESHSEKEKMVRPKPLIRQSTDITTLEKIWGPLFEGNIATPRLGQLLRGVAQYLVEDFEPKHSLVVTPSKMQKYYEDTKITSELYPWQMVFDDHTSSISRVYREIEAQHHLVQEELHERPDLPGLTPHGFERWSTLMILAHPEEEFERLTKAMMDMPICNFDNRSERFPKEISRRLFPKTPDLSVRQKLEKTLVTYCKVSPLPRSPGLEDQTRHQTQARAEPTASDSQAQTSTASATAAPPTQSNIGYSLSETTSAASQAGIGTERHQPSQSNTASDIAVENEDKATPQPIERERKPYSAQPGAGRNIDNINRPTTPPDSRSTTQPATAAATTSSSKVGRSFSTTANHPRPMDQSRSQTIPVNYNPPQHPRKAPLQPGMEGISIPSDPSITRNRTNSVLTPHQYTRSTRHRSPSANNQQNADPHRPEMDIPLNGPVYQPAGGYSSSYGTSPNSDLVDGNRHWGRDRDRDREHRRTERDYLPTTERDRRDSMRSSMYEMSGSAGGLGAADRGISGSGSAGVGIPIREPRPRYQSNTGGYSVSDVGRGGHYSSDEDYYRSAGTRTQKDRHGSNGATGYEGGPQYYR